ncbi:MAG: AraC family transcriptional regulator [Paludibacteraceae bacterium]|nr:AraC family transcriptional regulator [Paludibacteraceae bacterium]
MTSNNSNTYLRVLRDEYHSELLFLFVLSVCTVAGHWAAEFIPAKYVLDAILPVQHSANIAICYFGAWLLFRHSDGLRIRKAYAYTLLTLGITAAALLLMDYAFHVPMLRFGSQTLQTYHLLFCNLTGWLLLIYPTETLRPGWMNLRRAMYQLLPLVALVGLDYLVPFDLRWLIALYPVVLVVLALMNIRAYRLWCEDNYSSMDHIDAQWIVRYIFMVIVIGVSYIYVALSNNTGRVVTQNALFSFLYVYSIDQILFRRDPWEGIIDKSADANNEATELTDIRIKLEEWMEQTKPYLNPEFRLIDLRQVLPMNRTYLSQFIHDNYDCTFYRFVNRYRIVEAKRLMQEQPAMKVEDVATNSGFTSRTVFTAAFTKETGISPREWSKKCTNS